MSIYIYISDINFIDAVISLFNLHLSAVYDVMKLFKPLQFILICSLLKLFLYAHHLCSSPSYYK